jgi:hypothetical protein
MVKPTVVVIRKLEPNMPDPNHFFVSLCTARDTICEVFFVVFWKNDHNKGFYLMLPVSFVGTETPLQDTALDTSQNSLFWNEKNKRKSGRERGRR